MDNTFTTEAGAEAPAEDNLADMAGIGIAQDASTDAKPANLPEKFIDQETGEVRMEALVNSYLELERKLSTMIPRPETEEGRIDVLRSLGMPERPDEYDVDTSHGLFDADPDLNEQLHKRGFTLEQVQMVYDLAAEKLIPAILEMESEFRADSEVERLIEKFGGQEKWGEVSRQLLAYGKKNLPPEVLDNMASSFDGVMALYSMMKGQEPGVTTLGQADNVAGTTNEVDVSSMMRDPRYWREKDPAFIAKVTESFKRRYSEV